MNNVHPTQEFCVSRGLTLDVTKKQCVTPAPPPQSPPQVAQVPPAPPAPAPVAAVQPTPREHHRGALLVAVEPDAEIYPELKQDFDLMDELAHFVRASGYRCDSISALRPLPSHGFKMVCNRFTYKYVIEDNSGRWIVTAE